MITIQDVQDSGWVPSPDEPDQRFDSYKGMEYQFYWQDNGFCQIFSCWNNDRIFVGVIETKEELAIINKCVCLTDD